VKIVAILLLGACSFATVRVPPRGSPRVAFECSYSPAVVDTVGVVVAPFSAALVPCDTGDEMCRRRIGLLVAVPIALTFASSAIFGYVRNTQCRSRRDAASP
jgi:hypothetical protein